MIRDQNRISSRDLETKGSGISEHTSHFLYNYNMLEVCTISAEVKASRVYRSTGTLNLIIKYKW